jgi:hypothetical protein
MPSDAAAALHDMERHIDLAVQFVARMDYEAFRDDARTLYAVTRCLEISDAPAKDAEGKVRFVRWLCLFCPSGSGHFHRETAVNTKNRSEPAVTKMMIEFSRLRLSCWRRGSGSNRRIRVLQTLALPLGYRAGLALFFEQ